MFCIVARRACLETPVRMIKLSVLARRKWTFLNFFPWSISVLRDEQVCVRRLTHVLLCSLSASSQVLYPLHTNPSHFTSILFFLLFFCMRKRPRFCSALTISRYRGHDEYLCFRFANHFWFAAHKCSSKWQVSCLSPCYAKCTDYPIVTLCSVLHLHTHVAERQFEDCRTTY